jgi:membrane-associated protease RseP (regulator of RpoE activity)
MKTMIRVIGCLSIVLAITAGNLFSLTRVVSGEPSVKEKMKKPGWIGVMIQNVDKKIEKKEKLDSDEGAYVKEVIDDSPADSAGLKEGDVIVEFGGKKIFDSDDLSKAVRKTQPGVKVSVVIVRDGEKKNILLTVGKNKEVKHQRMSVIPNVPNVRVFVGNDLLGLKLLTLNEQLGEYFGAPNSEGVLVEEVEKESIGEKAGFKAGDVIVRVGKKAVREAEKIKRELQKYDEGDKVEFELLRKGTKKVLNVEVEEEEESFPQNFFFKRPHFQMFQNDGFDDAGFQLDINGIEPEINQLKLRLEQSKNELIGRQKEIQEQVQRTPHTPHNQVVL